MLIYVHKMYVCTYIHVLDMEIIIAVIFIKCHVFVSLIGLMVIMIFGIQCFI